MRTNRCWLLLLTGLFLVFLPRTVLAQTAELEKEIKATFNERAERIEIAGAEFRGRKTGRTEFTTCNGEKIDIGDKKPTKSGPCPQDGKPKQLFAFQGEIVGMNATESLLEIRAADKKIYSVYVPDYFKEIVISGEQIASANNVFATDVRLSYKLRDAAVNSLQTGSTVVIIMVLPGRAEAFWR